MYSKYIKEMHQKTGIPMKKLQHEWLKAEKEINMDLLKNPYKYNRISKNFLSFSLKDNVEDELYQAINQKFKENITLLKDYND